MPSRKDVFSNGNYYHIYDKTLDRKAIFIEDRYCDIFLNTAQFYSFGKHETSFSEYKRMNNSQKKQYARSHFKVDRKIIHVLAFTLMPNHYHFLIRQIVHGGIQHFMSNLVNSFTRYYNRSVERKGPIFLPQFKSVSILSLRQLLYTSKYIHLNPVKSELVNSVEELKNYRWTSYHEYTGYGRKELIHTRQILKHFEFNVVKYKKYLIGNGDLI